MWEKFTNDPWILETVKGYRIEFESQPFQFSLPGQINFNDSESCIVQSEINSLLEKGAIIESNHEVDEFISNIFVVPKPNGKFRPIINLKHLNKFVKYEHFKQEHFSIVLDLIQESDYFTSIDLQDAYFSVPLHRQHQKYVKFVWNGKLFAFVCLAFGLSSAPRVFTKILKPIYSWFRQQGIRCSYYIDDSLNMNSEYDLCYSNSETISTVLESLGFVVNKKKSVLLPTQKILYFGFIIDSVSFKVYLTEEKIHKIMFSAKTLIEKNTVFVRELASFIGMVINAFYAVLEAPLHYRSMERNKIQGLGKSLNFNNRVTLSPGSIQELNWWINNVVANNGKRIRPLKVSYTCRSDSSLQGWGGFEVESEKHASGRWSKKESSFHINYLELLAIFYSLQSFYKDLQGVHILVQSDNVSAVSYINNMGGMNSLPMDKLAFDIWQWCIIRNIYISAVFLHGVDNIEADYYSRNFSDSTEWMLKKDIFNRLCNHFFFPNIDLFASRLNKQIDNFVSWFPEPGSFHVDAFTLPWQNFVPYIFPPFNLVGKVINKILTDEVEKCILVFPYWKSQSWFPLVLANLASFPVRLPRHKDLLTLVHNEERHPLKQIQMCAVVLSGKACKNRELMDQASKLFCRRGVKELVNSTDWHGKPGVFGVYRGISIPFARLSLL
jgi:hypothetical protein